MTLHDIARKLFDAKRAEATSKASDMSTLQGTVVSDSADGSVEIAFDGDCTTMDGTNVVRIGTLAALKEGDQAIVLLEGGGVKRPTAIGSAGWGDRITASIVDTQLLIASKADIEDLEAANGHIENLEVDNLTIHEKLTLAESSIGNLEADTATIKGNLSAATAKIGTLEADTATINGKLTAAEADIDSLEADNATINGKLTAAEADIDSLEAETATITGTLNAHDAVIENLDANYAHITEGVIDNATIGHADVDGLNANYAHITSGSIDNATIDQAKVNNLSSNYAHITNGVIDNATIGYADVDNLSAHYAEITNGHINSALIDTAAIVDEQVFTVTGNKATISEINADTITVRNLHTSNLTVDTADGYVTIGNKKTPTKEYIDSLKDELQQEIDGAVETWTSTAVPLMSNYPTTQWALDPDDYDTQAEYEEAQRKAYAKHVGDICYVQQQGSDYDGFCYRFSYSNGDFSWVLIKDSSVTKALGEISDLQTFESETTSWIDETEEGLTTIRNNHTALSGVVDKTVKSSTQLWYTKANTTAPTKPTAKVTSTATTGNGWRTVVPAWNASYPNYYYCWQYLLADNTYAWSDVVRDIAMGESQGTSRSAQTTANANIKSSVQLWFTKANSTAPSKPTSQVTTNNAATGNAWNLAVPTYNASYPHYFYCYQQQKGDGTYQWSDVVYDKGTTEAMQKAQAALPATTYDTFVQNTFKELVDTVDEQSSTITTMGEKVETIANPNLSPFFSQGKDDVYNATDNPDGYWCDNYSAYCTNLSDGWVHFERTNTGTSTVWLTIYEHSAWRHANGDLKGSTNYTMLFEFRNVVKSGNVTCTGFSTHSTSWPSMFVAGVASSNVVDGEIRHMATTVADPSSVTGSTCSTRSLITIPAGASLACDMRVSLYESGEDEDGNPVAYSGPYKPYVVDNGKVTTLTNTINSVKQTADANSAHLSNLTQVLGTNADGTTKTNDIVHKYNNLDQTLDGTISTVGAMIDSSVTGANILTGNAANPFNWTVSAPDGASYTKTAYGTAGVKVEFTGVSGWEWLYSPAITVENGHKYTLSVEYTVGADYSIASGKGGFGLSAYSSAPPFSAYDVSNSAFLGRAQFFEVKTSKAMKATVTFTATSTTVYLGLNGGQIADSSTRLSFTMDNLKLVENIESRVSQAETEIEQSKDAIALRATKEEAYQVAQPNLSPLGQADLDNVYNATTNPKGYWKSRPTASAFTQLEDGWVHFEYDNTAGTAAWSTTTWRPRPCDSVEPDKPYTILTEIRNNTSTVSTVASFDMYLQQTANNQFWGNVIGTRIDDDHVTTNTSIFFGRIGEEHVQYSYRIADSEHLTTDPVEMFRYNFRVPVGMKACFDFRQSVYPGIYDGPYKPYSGSQLYASQAELKVANDAISLRVEKGGIIGAINLTEETAKIQANRIEIDGTTVFGNSTLSDYLGSNFVAEKTITTATDFDTLTATGSYVIKVGSNPNAPTTNWGKLDVTASGKTVQLWYPDAASYYYYRAKTGSTWSDWTKVDGVGAAAEVQENLDNLEIGGRNLLAWTERPEYKGLNADRASNPGGWYGYTAAAGVSDTDDGIKATMTGNSTGFLIPLAYPEAMESQTEYALSFDYRGTATAMGSIYLMFASGGNLAVSGPAFTVSETEWQHYETVCKWANFGSRTGVYGVLLPYGANNGKWLEIKDGSMKLEKGNKSTDWTPAPADQKAYVDNLKIGGTNLLRHTDTLEDTDWWTHYKTTSVAAGQSDPDGGTGAVLVTPETTAWYLSAKKENALLKDVGEEYTASVWLRADTQTTCKICVRYLQSDYADGTSATATTRMTVTVPTTWTKFSVTGTLTTAQTADSFWVGQSTTVPMYVYHPKVEKGAKATDWSASPEDVVAKSQRIYYRTSATAKPTAPTTWVTTNVNKWYANNTSAANWTTKVTPIANGTGASVTKYLYLYTCVQTVSGTGVLTNSEVLLDDSTTVIDGGKIITGSVTANQIDVGSIAIGNLSGGSTVVSNATNGNTAYNRHTAYRGTCSTAAGTAAKVAACTGFALASGATVEVYCSTANTANVPTLNVNSTGAKPIWINGAVASASNPCKWKAGDTVTFTYDGTQFRASLPVENYITADSTGIKIHDASDTTNYVHQSSSGTKVYKGGYLKANYADTISLYGGSNASGTYPKAEISSSAVKMYQNANNHADVDSSGLTVYQGGTNIASFGSTARIGSTASGSVRTTSTGIDFYKATAKVGSITMRSSSATPKCWSADYMPDGRAPIDIGTVPPSGLSLSTIDTKIGSDWTRYVTAKASNGSDTYRFVISAAKIAALVPSGQAIANYLLVVKAYGADKRNTTISIKTASGSALSAYFNPYRQAIFGTTDEMLISANVEVDEFECDSLNGIPVYEFSVDGHTHTSSAITDGKCYVATTIYAFNTSGTSGTVSLTSSAANFTFIDIFFKGNDGYYDFTRVCSPNGKVVNLSTMESTANGAVNCKWKAMTISGTSITNKYYGEMDNGGTPASVNHIYVCGVIGYK